MGPLAYEWAAPFIWAGAVVVVGGVTWVLRTATKTGVGDIVERKLEPIRDTLGKHSKRLNHLDRRLTEVERVKEPLRVVPPIEDEQ